MLELSRTVRFCLSEPGPSGSERAMPRSNTFSAWPAMRGLGRYYELEVSCHGEPDPTTGYLINIKLIDEAVRDHALPYLEGLLAERTPSAQIAMGQLLRNLVARLQQPLGGTVTRLHLRLTPTHGLEIRNHDMDHVRIRQRYEFSAAHRLHVAGMSDQENRRIFGKCNNAAGHGHNYQLDVEITVPIDPAGHTLSVERLDDLVKEHVIDKLDHKHLNTDVAEFAGVNPSVEQIARVIWNLLADKMERLAPTGGVDLDAISVWETAKTVCTYRGREPVQLTPNTIK